MGEALRLLGKLEQWRGWVQLAEACHQSNRERRWIDLPELKL
jgi:hypothetical protein